MSGDPWSLVTGVLNTGRGLIPDGVADMGVKELGSGGLYGLDSTDRKNSSFLLPPNASLCPGLGLKGKKFHLQSYITVLMNYMYHKVI